MEKNCRQEIVVPHRCQPKPRPCYWHFPHYTNQGNAETWARVAEWRKQMDAVLRADAMAAFPEPQGAAGILPAEESEKSSALARRDCV